MTTTILSNASAPAGGEDGIGLSITVSADPNDNPEKPTYIPPSVETSPIPFEDDDDDDYDDDDDGGNDNNNNNTESIAEQPAVSSIMRESSRQESQSNQSNATDPAHVAALEDRVRDLEEKLSTLSMLLMQQQHQRSFPNTKRNNSILFNQSSPDNECSSVGDDSSISPPSTPFRSLASFSTLPSSNVPVLESPTPVMRRFRNPGSGSGSFRQNPDSSFGEFALPYEQRSPRHANSNLRSSKIARGLRNNLSYHILHANDGDELDLSSRSGDTGSKTTTTNESGSVVRRRFRTDDDSFEKACMVPSLDSLPGSSRTSPILSKDPIVAGVLSPPSDGKCSESGDDNSSNRISSTQTMNASSALFSSPPLLAKASSGTLQDVSSKTIETTNSNAKIRSGKTRSDSVMSEGTKHKKKRSNIKSKWLDYLNSVQESNYDTDKQMEEFVKVPSAVEALLSFGFWISVDSFLYTLTMLPLRFVYSTFLLSLWVYWKITGRKASKHLRFHRHNSYHLIQVSIIYIIYAYVLKPINISIMYHQIRNQSMVKLYLLVAIVEVFDRLMCSLGQDCLDSLYWNTTRRPRSQRLIVSALLVLLYTALHSFLLFVHVATLNVAMNSDDQALLSLLIGGNFAEIKSTVFKKYNKATLFKITASDICERFKLALFLFLVLMLNASQGMDQKMLKNYLSMCGIVVGSEWLSDWLKHSFITKFNYIASGVYSEYSLLLAGDVSGFGHEGENLDMSHAVVKRLGLAQIPLVCVMAKYLKEAYKYQTYENQPQTWLLVVGTVSVWLILLAIKLSLASLIVRMCKNKLEAAPEFSKNNTTVAKKKTN